MVAATKPEDAAKLRERYPQQLFLVPGSVPRAAGRKMWGCPADGTGVDYGQPVGDLCV